MVALVDEHDDRIEESDPEHLSVREGVSTDDSRRASTTVGGGACRAAAHDLRCGGSSGRGS
jgi:hypothetical protein